MTLFESIKAHVSAHDAAEAYGLRFRGKRAQCPWHDDRHPDLAFYEDGTCYCHACHHGGDAVALTARIFGLSMLEAARKINADFALGLEPGKPVPPSVRNRMKEERAAREKAEEENRREWRLLCSVRQEADRQMEAALRTADRRDWDKVWDSPQFIRALSYRARADNDLDRVWEEKTAQKAVKRIGG